MRYKLLYQSKSSDDGIFFNYEWRVWKSKIPTLQEAELEKQRVVRIFGCPARIISYKTKKT